MSLNIAVRVIGMLLFATAGFFLGLYLAPSSDNFNELVLPLTFLGALFGLLITPYMTIYPLRWVRTRLKMMPAQDLVSAVLGLFIGLLLGAILSFPLSSLPGWAGEIAPTLATLVLAYLGVYAGVLRKRDVLDVMRTGRRGEMTSGMNTGRLPRLDNINYPTSQFQSGYLDNGDNPQPDKYLLMDTSAIIDGRIADITKTGFVDGTLLVPRFVLNELQHIADSADPLRRARGRRGLDMLNRLQKELVIPVQISEVDAEDVPEVDGKLIKIARVYHCPIITNDFNLNRVAEIQGVRVLNMNELANAVKPVVLPGEEMHVHVIQEGKELGQGVAYLDDGTMVVVENGRKYMNSDVDVVVTRVLQTVAGRMIFAQMKNGKA
ncbi:MAG TPA: PIN domain-containing protein [Chloroflexia bacterium]|nr:PIN domain-containing protein [Chloroflexia bacterium]